MTHLLKPQELRKKLEQAKWIAYGYAWGKHDTLPNFGLHIRAVFESHGSFYAALKDIRDKYLPSNDQGGTK